MTEKLVRLILSDRLYSQEPCNDCVRDAAKGWMKPKEMRPIYERACGELCTCELEFNWEPTSEEIRRAQDMARKISPQLYAFMEQIGMDPWKKK